MHSRAPRRAIFRLALALVPAILLLPLLAGCGATPEVPGPSGIILGTGDVVTEFRDLAPFTRVSVGAGLKVIIGEAEVQQVTVGAQQNLLPAIRTEVVDGQLIVTIPSPGVTATQPMTLTLRMTQVESVVLSAGSVGYLEHTGAGLNLDVSGGAEITAIGDTPDLTLTASTGSHAWLGELVAQRAEIVVNDGSSAELNVVTALTGTADGGATVTLTHKPAQVTVATSSGATVQGG
jgi:hypothetical protein